MHCDKCGFDNPSGMRFCGQCAAPLQRPCPACGFANPPNFAFCGQCAAALDTTTVANTPLPVAAPTPPPSAAEHALHEAERRQLTVLFCDMVGSSALSERLDPEELRDIMCGYRATCNDVVQHFDGHVAQYLGDGILVYFGYPQAHEDDARRATQAALEIVAHIPDLRYTVQQGEEVRLSVRIGVHTGLVVVGEIGDGDKRTLALGETPNIAARLQELSSPGSVVISSATHRLIKDDFEFSELGSRLLKGFSQPLNLYRVDGERSTQQRLQASRSQHGEPLVGRGQETALLMEHLEQARKGVGQVVLLGGEAGLGKTRMVQIVIDKVANEPCLLLECGGSPYYQNSFLFPVIDLVQRTLGLADITESAAKYARLQQSVATLGLDNSKVVPILAELLSIPTGGGHTDTPNSTPQQRKREILDTLVTVLQTMAQQRLVLLVVEDLHWVDPSTLELLTLLVERPGLTNLFALFTFRNEFSPPWHSRANLTLVTLNRLTRQQSGHLVRQIARGKTLPMDVFAEIIHKTDGVPYFVEELTHMVLNSDLLEEKADHYALKNTLSELAIPSTLQDSLMSRLDSLGEDKELAQLSATLGREFGHDLLSAIANRDEGSLQRGLTHLITAELFFQRGQSPQASYSFRHALLREVAYQSLLKRTRQQYHHRIAGLLKERFPHSVQTNPELLAHHCTEASLDEEAVDAWLAAGQLAVQRSANLEAASHLNNGLRVLARLADSPQRKARELTLQTTLGLALMMSKGYAAPEVEKAYARARTLCHHITDITATFPVLCGLWEYYIVRADLKTADALANELLSLAEQGEQPEMQLEARRTLGTSRFWQGRLSEALDLLSPLHKAAGAITAPALTARIPYCQDVRVAAFANTACVLWLLGYPDQALAQARRALAMAKQLAHPFSQAYALQFLAVVHQLRGEREATRQQAEAQIALSETYGFAFWSATGRMLRAWAHADGTTAGACGDAFAAALQEYEATGSRLVRPYFLALRADLYYQVRQDEAAKATLEMALRETAANGEGFFTSELLRLRGIFYTRQDNLSGAAQEAEEHLLKALEHARRQEARSLALRTATDLARLWDKEGRQTEAMALLEQELATIGEGDDTHDIRAARALLA